MVSLTRNQSLGVETHALLTCPELQTHPPPDSSRLTMATKTIRVFLLALLLIASPFLQGTLSQFPDPDLICMLYYSIHFVYWNFNSLNQNNSSASFGSPVLIIANEI